MGIEGEEEWGASGKLERFVILSAFSPLYYEGVRGT